MILDCPSCQARYLISAQLFVAGPRQVRCARCIHEWQAELPKEIDAVGPSADADLTPAPEALAPLPPGSNLPVVQKEPMSPGMRKALWSLGSVIFIILVLIGLVEGRYAIVQKFPVVHGAFEFFGLPVYHTGEGLSFIGVRSELRYEGGKMLLAVEGKIHNASASIRAIPNIRVMVMGSDGKIVQSWEIPAPASRVLSGDDQEFHSSIDAPKDAIAEIDLSFIESQK